MTSAAPDQGSAHAPAQLLAQVRNTKCRHFKKKRYVFIASLSCTVVICILLTWMDIMFLKTFSSKQIESNINHTDRNISSHCNVPLNYQITKLYQCSHMETTTGIKSKTRSIYRTSSARKSFLHAQASKSAVWEHDVSRPWRLF